MPTAKATMPAAPLTDAAIVAAYIRNNRPRLAAELAWFAQPAAAAAAIKRAAAAQGQNGNRLSHQYRLSQGAIGAASKALVNARGELWAATDFDELFDVVEDKVLRIPGIGPLYVYDTALRIGAFREILPERVYLHAGARVGARRLLRVRNVGPVEIDDFPRPYRELPAYEIENLLCSYRRNFAARSALR